MQAIKELSNEELFNALTLLPFRLDSKQRNALERRLFIREQTRSPPPPLKRKEPKNAYFLLDIRPPQRWKPGESILKRGKGGSKSVRFKPTEIFGEEAIFPHCSEKLNGKTINFTLHNRNCPNFSSETPEVLGEHTWMNRQFHLISRYGIKANTAVSLS